MCECQICTSRNKDFLCNVIGESICKSCCDEFQSSQLSHHWKELLVNKDRNEIVGLKENCLECSGLFRDVTDKKDILQTISYDYKGKYVFSNFFDHSDLFLKKKKMLIETLGYSSEEDLFSLAETYYFLGDINKVKDLLEPVVDQSKYVEIPLLLSKAYQAEGDVERAKAYLMKCLIIDSKNPEPYRELGELYELQEDYVGSIYYHNEALKKTNFELDGPDDAFVDLNYLGLAVSYSKIEKYEEAIEAGEKFLNWRWDWDTFARLVHEYRTGSSITIGIDSDISALSTVYELMAIGYLELDNLEMSEKYIDRAAILSPESTNIAKTKGIIIGRKHNQGQVEQYKEQLHLLKQNAELRAGSMARLKMLSPENQVKFYTENDQESVQRFLMQRVFDNLKKVEELAITITPSSTQPAEEDRYTDLFKSHMDSNLIYPLGWITYTQSRGGYTREEICHRGGIGERDIVICSHQNIKLMIGEALVLKSVDTASIKEHTEKVFGYDATDCNFYAVIVWGFSENPNRIWAGYKNTVLSHTYQGFSILEHGEVEALYPGINQQNLLTFYTKHSTDREGKIATLIHIYVDVCKDMRRKSSGRARGH